MADFVALPISDQELNAIRLNARKRFATSRNGTLLRRKLGQSLEYREHRAYTPGDDARFIDWRASARQGGKHDYLIRSFEAEEQFSLLMVVDVGATMRLPATISKLQVALWLCEAMAKISEKEKLQIAFLPLTNDAYPLRYSKNNQIRSSFKSFRQHVHQPNNEDDNAKPGIRHLQGKLPQSSATIFISDFYMEDTYTEQFIRLAEASAKGMRQVVICELNSWPSERNILEKEIVSLRDVGSTQAPKGIFQASKDDLSRVEATLEDRRASLRKRLNLGGIVQNRWDFPPNLNAFVIKSEFQKWFYRFLQTSDLFGRVR
ncbi:MAG: DUF58 domain-containing protein [Lentilitoribacter sp.]